MRCEKRCESKPPKSRLRPQPSSTVNRFARPKVANNAVFDAGKRVPGRKRQIVVDSLGLLLMVVVYSASVQDQIGAQ